MDSNGPKSTLAVQRKPPGSAMSSNEDKTDASNGSVPLIRSIIEAATGEDSPEVPGGAIQEPGSETAPPVMAKLPWDPMKAVRQMAEGIVQQGSDQQPAGDKLSLYELIGRGGFGCVYRGRWRNMDVAVKVSLRDVPQ